MAYSVTEAFVSWLQSLGYSASTYPPKTGTEFVTVSRTGGSVSDMVDRPMVAVQTWAKTEERAEEMATEIRDAALTGPRPFGVASIRINAGPYPFWDESTRLPRYQLYLDCAAQLIATETE